MSTGTRRWRDWSLRLGLLAAIVSGPWGCARDRRAWATELAAAGADRLVGAWSIRLSNSHPLRPLATASVTGSVAFTLNSERIGGPGSTDPPMLLGTYSVNLESLGLVVGSGSGFPEASAVVRGDSVAITLAPGSPIPMELQGVLRGDSLVGHWRVASRSAAGGEGLVEMLRRP
ncbi:MAG TPA: hypothetical protein VFU23_03830 [Gemmatimonadales bacterium]|nr:hypothetical protein [Gemmatimonadales bacterium]